MKYLNYLRNFVKENLGSIIFLVCFYLLLNIELPYAIYKPGGAINLHNRITSTSTYKEEGSISMTYVSMVKGSCIFYLLSKVLPNWDAVKTESITYDGKTLKQTEEIDRIYLNESISNATVLAFNKAGVNYNVKSKKQIITYSDKRVKDLKYGDILLKVDSIDVDKIETVQNYLKEKKIGDTVNVLVKRNNKEMNIKVKLIDIDGKPKMGVSFATIYDLSSDYNIKFKAKNSESGPSGGLMSSLEIYNLVTKKDITGGKKVMGTGTITSNGIVGEIGGVKYKLLGAKNHKADIFICPKENYKEALKVKKEKSLKIDICGVSTFDEALNCLN